VTTWFGRRPVLLAALLGLGLDYIFLSLCANYCLAVCGPHPGWRGITGASFTTATAYIADISARRRKRAQNFGLVGAAFGLGFIIGPVIGGQSCAFRAPGYRLWWPRR
jgi:DHA1 family tetracycline resistance protein-like MFS transporter